MLKMHKDRDMKLDIWSAFYSLARHTMHEIPRSFEMQAAFDELDSILL